MGLTARPGSSPGSGTTFRAVRSRCQLAPDDIPERLNRGTGRKEAGQRLSVAPNLLRFPGVEFALLYRLLGITFPVSSLKRPFPGIGYRLRREGEAVQHFLGTHRCDDSRDGIGRRLSLHAETSLWIPRGPLSPSQCAPRPLLPRLRGGDAEA